MWRKVICSGSPVAVPSVPERAFPREAALMLPPPIYPWPGCSCGSFELLSAASQGRYYPSSAAAGIPSGYLVVVDSKDGHQSMQPGGVVTDRDIVTSVIAREVDPRPLRVGDVMTQHPVTIGVAKSVAKALREMRRIGARRLPVVGKRGELIGVLSLDEVL